MTATDAGERQAERQKLIDTAFNGWVSQLVDLGASNRLLYYRTLKTGALELDRAVQTRITDLRQGATVRLRQLFPQVDLSVDSARRMRAISGKALENFEERGIRTLYLTRGMATWRAVGSNNTPAAPILLFPLRAKRRDATGEDFDLSIEGDPEINPALLQLIRTRHGVDIDGAALVDDAYGDAGDEPDERVVYDRLFAACTALEGFAISERHVIGNFSFAKLPMVSDLTQSRELASRHPFVAALAGDAEARAAVAADTAVPIDLPDRLPPAADHLVLDADASQSLAINRVLAGESITVQGPPGSGKSQTIANMIASLAAEGKRVLFVAEKRAAISAVVERLAAAGLQEIVFDLYSHSLTKRDFARGLMRPPFDDYGTEHDSHRLHEQLGGLRDELRAHAYRMHVVRPPWNVSLYDLQADMYSYDEVVQTSVVMPIEQAAAIDRGKFRELAEIVREHTSLRRETEPSQWAGAEIATQTDAQVAVQTAKHVADYDLPQIDGALRRLCQALALRAPRSPFAWSPIIELFEAAARVFQAFKPQIFEGGHDLSQLREALATADQSGVGGKMSRQFSNEFRRARADARALLRDGVNLDDSQLYRGIATAEDLRRRWRSAGHPQSLPRPVNDLDRLVGLQLEMHERLSDLAGFLPWLELDQLDASALADTARELDADGRGAYAQPRLREIEAELDDYHLIPVLNFVHERQLSPDQAIDAARFCWLRSIYSAFAPEVMAFDVEAHDDRCADYRRLDHMQQELNVARAREAVQSNIAALRYRHPDQMALIEREAARDRGHMVPRELVAQAGDVVTALRPCWTMSPLSVAHLLPPARQLFDVVIFDEASQLRTADAVLCMLRAPQVVIVGDSEQLRPSPFVATDIDDDLDEEELVQPNYDGVIESVLDAANRVVTPSFLRSHYRSHDERLIGFSNARFYANTLTTFPSTVSDLKGGDRSFLRHEIVGTRSDEVHLVVQLVLEHARNRPQRSLGIIAFDDEHAQRIREALRRARVTVADADLIDAFFDESRPQRLFVKNVENAQGDERDHIILTLGCERRETNQLSHRYGALNPSRGERRLNVAVTRAREQLTLITAFGPGDLDLQHASAGVVLLREFMLYIDAGGDLGPMAAPAAPLDPFLAHVQLWLGALGVPCTPLYGSSGHRIDFALPHPTEAGRYRMAVETDGPPYAAARTTRDRDRLRPETLERLGWRYHRVWSAAWYRNPRLEAERIKAAWLARD